MKKEIKINIGGVFELRLPGYQTSGYQWVIKTPQNRYFEVTPFTISNHQNSDIPGKNVDQLFLIKAKITGTHNLKIILKRNWESKPIESITYTIEIADNKSVKY
jgi:predicted secreted protein